MRSTPSPDGRTSKSRLVRFSILAALILTFASAIGCGTVDGGLSRDDTGTGDAGDTGTGDGGSDSGEDSGTDSGEDSGTDGGEDTGDVGNDTGGACDSPNPAGCTADSECADGQLCTVDPDQCLPSSCFCDEASGVWACTEDCGGGVCVDAGGSCETDDECAYGAEWCEDGECVECDNSAIVCDLACPDGYGFVSRNGCTPCECVPLPGPCDGPNPAGCSSVGCPAGEICQPTGDAVCLPSSCFCDEASASWICTDDCGGGGTCEPAEPGECDSDDDCEIYSICMDGTCTEIGCPDVWDPVCGVDGTTYGNACEARANHVEIAYAGECRDDGCTGDRQCPVGELCLDGVCEGVDCPAIYAPVCGVDGNTYGNACSARLAHVEVAYDGECRTTTECTSDDDCPVGQACFDDGNCYPIGCPDIWDPVCGVDGRTYGNACEADAARVEIAYEGPCRVVECDDSTDCPEWHLCIDGVCEVVGCPDIWSPVCGVDGRTYGNECEAAAAGVEVAYGGECIDGCPRIWDPVCGVDGMTYSNECEADRAGVEIVYPGECDVDPPMCDGDDACPLGWECIDGVCVGGCFDIWDPVCGIDGVTYANECEATSAGVEIAYRGECEGAECRTREDCPTDWHDCIDGRCVVGGCPDVWLPVCGVDGNTYGNDCEAAAAGVAIAYEGECGSDGRCTNNADCPDGEVCYPPTDMCSPRCAIDCIIPDPVCGTDGMTYWCGQQDAWCNGAEVAYDGECGSPECESNEDCPTEWHICTSEGICEVFGCPDIWAPVCGVDGTTYGNDCEAAAAGVEIAYPGECGSDDRCSSNADCPAGEICYPPTNECGPRCSIMCIIPDPVCGTDGITYICGQQDAWCNGAEVAYDGACEDAGRCEGDTDCPIGEICEMGECQTQPCPLLYAPVCGEDGVTYSNDCFLRQAHVEALYDGVCRACRDDADCDPATGEYCNPDICIPSADGTCAGLCMPPRTDGGAP